MRHARHDEQDAREERSISAICRVILGKDKPCDMRISGDDLRACMSQSYRSGATSIILSRAEESQ